MASVRMRSDSKLDYAIFQLTPTRTRCELLVAAQGSTYKLASGLLKPFISHLKSAEEQLAKGGYSIRLEPPDPGMTLWFTKATMERFVRFVSTPELLERASTVEVELIELDETSDRQNTAETCETNGLAQAENPPLKASANPSLGGKSMVAVNSDKLSKTTPDATETSVEEGSKHRLLRALEARRVMLQKEQGMAFARALAAGFSLENMADLVQFSECFGATRLREACIKFMALYRKRQEAGLVIEEIDIANSQAEMAAYLGTAGIEGWSNSHPDVILASENGTENSTGRASSDEAVKDQRPSSGNGDAASGTETGRGPRLVQGNPMLSPWQGLPYMQNGLHHAPYGPMPYGLSGQVLPGQPGLPYAQYMGSPYMPPQPYPHMPPQYWPGTHPESTPNSISRPKDVQERPTTMLNGEEEHDDDIEGTLSDEAIRRPTKVSASTRRRSASPMRRVQIGRTAGSKRSGMVVIRNINYIASKTQKPDEDEDEDENSGSWGSEDDGNDEDGRFEALRGSVDEAVGLIKSFKHGHKDGKPKSTKKGKKKSSAKVGGMGSNAITLSGYDSESGKESDKDSETRPTREDDREQPNNTEHNKVINEQRSMISEEGNFFMDRVRQKNSMGLAFDTSELEYKVKQMANAPETNQYSTEDMVVATQREIVGKGIEKESHPFDMIAEQEQQVHNKQMAAIDDSMIVMPENRSASIIRDNVIMDAENQFASKAIDTKLSDESFILVDRSTTSKGFNNHQEWKRSFNLDSEMPLDMQSGHSIDASVVDPTAQESTMLEPQELFMFPDRSKDANKRAWESVDYDMQVLAADMMENEPHNQAQDDVDIEGAEKDTHEQEDESAGVTKKTVSKVVSEKDAKAKAVKEMLDRRRSIVGGRIASGRSNPLAEAQLRAEKLRAYKADLQKSKKEKEDEDRKRIENLKNQRKERIAARTLSAPASNGINRAGISITPPPKQTQKLSGTSSVSPRDKASSAARLARLSSPKSIDGVIKETRKNTPVLLTLRASSESPIPSSKSIDGVTKETRKSTPVLSTLRASNESPIPPSKKPITGQAMEVSSDTKTNGYMEEKTFRTKALLDRSDVNSVGQAPGGRTNATAIKKAVVSDSINVKSLKGLTVSSSTNEKIAKQSIVSDSVDEKTVKKVSVPSNMVSSPKPTVGIIDTKQAKKAPVSMEKKTSPAPQTKVVSEKALTTQGSEPSQQQNVVLNVDNFEIVPKAAEPLEILKSFENANDHGAANNGLTSHEKDGPRSDAILLNKEEPLLELKTLDATHRAASPKATVSASFTDEAELEIEESSFPGEDYEHAPIVHASSSEDISKFTVKAEPIAGNHKQVSYENPSPHFSPSSWTASSPCKNLSNFDESTLLDSTHDGSSRSRKKWGDSKAKGLKKLLLLGRKSKRDSSQSSSGIIPSEGEGEEDEASFNEARFNNEQVSGSISTQSQLKSEGSSSSKGSRSFFSLSLRGRSSAVKA